mgnify:CR=1 FL=1
MAAIYVDLIEAGLRTYDQVPSLWKDEVKQKLDEEGIPY